MLLVSLASHSNGESFFSNVSQVCWFAESKCSYLARRHIQPPPTASATVKTENGIQQIPEPRTTAQPTLTKPQPLQPTTTTNTSTTQHPHKPQALPEKKDST